MGREPRAVGPPMTLGNAAAAHVRLIVWCKACGHRVERDPAEIPRRYGPETTVPDWRERLVCSRCASHEIDMVVTGSNVAEKAKRASPDAPSSAEAAGPRVRIRLYKTQTKPGPRGQAIEPVKPGGGGYKKQRINPTH
jgi:hypothetical protein